MTSPQKFRLQLDMNVLNHLGIGLYSSTPAVVTEIIANAWDADSTLVTIDINANKGIITVEDNGHGMDALDLQEKFLRVGYARRETPDGSKSPAYRRPVMGRKGIGKLAMFSLASQIEIWSHKQGAESVAARIDVEKLKEAIRENKDEAYVLETPSIGHNWNGRTGTRIVLSQLLTGIDKTESYLRPRLARRFSVLGPQWKFEVELNGIPIAAVDRQYQQDLQFLWDFDDETRSNLLTLASSIATDENGEKCVARLDPIIDPLHPQLQLRGFIGTVDRPNKLKKLDANINQISLFANGRVFQEDVLGELGNSQIFNSYLIGEVHADFLDLDDTDRATANRETVKHADPMVVMVRNRLTQHLRTIASQWDEWRRQISPDLEDEKLSQAITLWLDSLQDNRDRSLADRLVKNISRIEPTNDEQRNKEIKKDLLRSTIVGFEKLRIKKQLDRLSNVTDVLSPEFQAIFTQVDDIEATYYHDITRSRLQIIEDFETKIVDAATLERVAQRYLTEHLWLLDPTWDRVSGSETTEQLLTKELKEIDPTTDSGARLDIAYRTSSSRHVIVELKRPGKVRLNVFSLLEQGDRYRGAMNVYLAAHPDLGGLHGRAQSIDVYFVVEELPVAAGSDAVETLRKSNMQAFTYKGLITNARRAYQEYLRHQTAISRIDQIIKAI